LKPWQARLSQNPFGTMIAAAAVILGILGMVLGDGVSQGMTLSLHSAAAVSAHLWGVMFAAGGSLKLYGLYGGRAVADVSGLWLQAGGYAFYAITVIAGLHVHGLAAGIIATALAVGCVLKVHTIQARAPRRTRRPRRTG
jgi:hypothetical protein